MSKLSFQSYNPQVGLSVTEFPDVQTSADKLAASLQNFSNTVAEIPQKQLAEDVETSRQALQNNISQTFQQFAEKAVENRNGAQGLINYDAQAKAYSANVLASAGNQKQYTTNLLNYYSNAHRITVQQKVFQQAQLSAFAAFVEHDALQNNDTNIAIHNSTQADGEHQFDAAQSLTANRIKNWKNALQQGLMGKAEFASAYKSILQNFQISCALKQYNDALNSGNGDKFVQSYLDKNVPFLDDVQKIRSVLPLFKALNNTKTAELAIDTDNLNQMMKDSVLAVKNGGLPNSAINEILTQTGNEKKLNEYREKIADAEYYSSAMQELITTPIGSDRQKALNKYLPTDINSPTYGRDLRVYNEILAGIDNYQKEVNKDPISFYRQSPFIQNLINKRINAEGVNSTAEWNPQSLINDPVKTPDRAMINLQLMAGRNYLGPDQNMVRVMGNDDVKATIAQLNNAEPMQQVGLLNGLRDYYKENYTLALNDLKRGGLKNDLTVLGMVNPANPYIDQISRALSTPEKILTDKSVLDPEAKKNIDDAVLTINSTSVFSTALKSAIQLVYNVAQSRPLVGLNNIRNQVYRAPTGDSSVDFKNFMDSTDGFAGGGDPTFKKSMNDALRRISYQLVGDSKTAMSPTQAVQVAFASIAGNYQYTRDGQQTLRIPNQYNPDVVMRYAEIEKSKLPHFDFVLDKTSDATSEIEKEGYYLREVKPGHWGNDQFDRGLVWITASGRALVDKDGHTFHFLFDDAHNSIPTEQQHPGKKLLSPVQELKLGNSMSTANAIIDNGFTP